MVGAAVVLEPGPDGNVTAARVALTGVGEVALRIPEAEALLTGDLPSDERLAEVQAVVREAVRPRDDGGGYGAAHRDVAGVIAPARRVAGPFPVGRRVSTLRFEVNGSRYRGRGRAAPDPCRLPARRPRAYRHPPGLRARRLWRLHGAP